MRYLAFDFGDGTTCVAQYTPGSGAYEPKELPIARGRKELWSNMGFEADDQVEDERNAVPGIRGDSRGYPKVVSNWKTKPSCISAENRKRTVMFMKLVARYFLAENATYCEGGDATRWKDPASDYKVIIGIPCDWSESDKEEYEKMAFEAGFPNVSIFRESQAAILYARKFQTDSIEDKCLEDGVLLIDVGSSTTDFSYIRGWKIAHRGLALGAKLIERRFLMDAARSANYVYNGSDDIRITTAEKRLALQHLLKVREDKERYFSDAAQAPKPELWSSELKDVEWRIGIRDDTGYFIGPSYVDHCLNDEGNSDAKFKLDELSDFWKGFQEPQTWRGHFRNALERVKNKLKVDVRGLTIFLTGGATRMGFIKVDVRSVFGDGVRYLFGDDETRSFAVAKGLAWTGYVVDLVNKERQTFRCKVQKFMGLPKVVELIKSKIVMAVSRAATDNMMQELKRKYHTSKQSLNTRRKQSSFVETVVKRSIEKFLKNELALFEEDKKVYFRDVILAAAIEIYNYDEARMMFKVLQDEVGRGFSCVDGTMNVKLELQQMGMINLENVCYVIDLQEIGKIILDLGIEVINDFFLHGPLEGMFEDVFGGFGKIPMLSTGLDDKLEDKKIDKYVSHVLKSHEKIILKIAKMLSEKETLKPIASAVEEFIVVAKARELDSIAGECELY